MSIQTDAKNLFVLFRAFAAATVFRTAGINTCQRRLPATNVPDKATGKVGTSIW